MPDVVTEAYWTNSPPRVFSLQQRHINRLKGRRPILLEHFCIHNNSLTQARKEGIWPLWLLNSIKLSRPLYLRRAVFVTSKPLGSRKVRGSLRRRIKGAARDCGGHLLLERWGKRQSERQAARCHQCREMGVKRMKTYKWKSIRGGRKA